LGYPPCRPLFIRLIFHFGWVHFPSMAYLHEEATPIPPGPPSIQPIQSAPMKHVVIIGNGIAGVTAARYIRKFSRYSVTLISAESKYFFSRTALMYVYMGHMRMEDITPYEPWFWDKNDISLIQAYVQAVDIHQKKLSLSNGKDMHYDTLVIASGSTFNKFDWPGQDLEGVGGLYSLQDLDYMETYTRKANRAVVVGGGLIGIEMAEMLLSRGIQTTFLVRENSYWSNVLPAEESAMVNRHIREHHVDLRLGTELKRIIGDEYGRVKAVETSAGDTIECQWVGLTAGVRPNVEFLKHSGIELGKGVKVDEFFRTSAPDVYAIGDCAEFRTAPLGRGTLEQIWYSGKMHGEQVAANICKESTPYQPGVFFNSAKFFDIEYQTYGHVPPTWTSSVDSLYWEHPDGQRSIRILYEQTSQKVLGFNLMGVRYRHKVCERWIRNETPIAEVLLDLRAANFDPEFFSEYEPLVIAQYNSKTGSNLRLRKRRQLFHLIFGR